MAFDEEINDEITLLGETVTIRSVGRKLYNKHGDINISGNTSDRVTVSIPNILGNDDLEVQEGKFQNGDKRFFFRTYELNMSSSNRVFHDSKWYEIEEVLKHRLQNEIAGYEVLARKI